MMQWDCKTGSDNQTFFIIPAMDPKPKLTKLTAAQKISMNKFNVPSGWISFLGNTKLCVAEMGKGKKTQSTEMHKKKQ